MGKITKGLFVLHKCDNRSCVNPKHLFLGTQQDNIRDMINKGRANYKGLGIHRGEEYKSAKLTAQKVLKIRALMKKGVFYKEIAERFNISPSHVYTIANRKSWTHI